MYRPISCLWSKEEIGSVAWHVGGDLGFVFFSFFLSFFEISSILLCGRLVAKKFWEKEGKEFGIYFMWRYAVGWLFSFLFPTSCHRPNGVIYCLGTLVYEEIMPSVWLPRKGGDWDLRIANSAPNELFAIPRTPFLITFHKSNGVRFFLLVSNH